MGSSSRRHRSGRAGAGWRAPVDLERLSRTSLSRSAARHSLELRLNTARLLLLQTNMSIIDVALACGFVSASHFSKCYRDFFGRTPRKERGLPADFVPSESESLSAAGGR